MKKYLMIILLFFCSCVDNYVWMPRNLSWANIDTNGDEIPENYIPSVKRQPCGDCFLYSAVGLLEIQFQIDHKVSSTLNLSEQSLHNCLRIACDGAGDQRIILNHIKDYGVMEEDYSKTGEWFECLSCLEYIYTGIGITQLRNIPFYTFRDYVEIVSPKMPYADRKMAMVAALQYGPLAMDISGWSGWRRDYDVLFCEKGDPSGHSLIVVGYENYGETFIVKNSHGEGTLLKMVFDGGDKCGFAHFAHQIAPGSTYISYGLGNKFCYSMRDGDGDRIPDAHDNCPYVKNSDQSNVDGDLLGDICDPCPKEYNSANGYYCL